MYYWFWQSDFNMSEDIKRLEKTIEDLQKALDESRQEAKYYQRIAENSGKRRIKEIHQLSELISERKRVEASLRVERNKLQKALAKIKKLSGLLPLCSNCKKIRDDKGYWNKIETYIRNHSEAEFSHGLCPDCAQALYSDYFKRQDEAKARPLDSKTR